MSTAETRRTARRIRMGADARTDPTRIGAMEREQRGCGIESLA